MTNPFLSYHFINAERIIKLNIRSNQTKEDLTALLKTLIPLKCLVKSNIPEGSSIDRSIIEKLAQKSEIINLLDYFGYVRNNIGEYIYHVPESNTERERRQNGLNEFQKFFNDLKNIENNSLEDFEQFIRDCNKQSVLNSNNEFDEEQVHSSSSSHENFISSSFPHRYEINQGNERTYEIIKLLKKNLVTKYNAPLTHGFIRRKLALLLFKQKYPDSNKVGDNLIDETIDQKIHSLKQNDKQANVPRTDDIYIECLIRSNFDNNKALEILYSNRPNLTLPIEQPVVKKSPQITIANLIQSLKPYLLLLNQTHNDSNVLPQILHQNDKWTTMTHLIPAILKLRQKNNVEIVNEVFLSKMYRLLYSELSHVISQQMPVKIETLASVLCESPLENIENLDIVTIKDILRSNGDSQFHEDFRSHIINSLSIMCPICTSSFPRSQMETMLLCNHTCCLECIKNYYRNNINKIRDFQSLNILTCFQEVHEITIDTRLNFFVWLEAKFIRWFVNESDILKRYHEILFYATRDKQIKKCGNSKCVSYFDVGDNNDIVCINCPHCHFAQCRQCCQKWYPDHIEMECNEYEQWLIDNDPEDPHVQVLKYLSTTGIVCPNEKCQAIYEYKAGGCEHFTCDECNTDFCRMCSALFYSPTKGQKCPQVNCILTSTLHAHCCPNCFRETRISETDAIIKLLNDHHINVSEELQNKPVSTNKKCPIENCGKPTSKNCGDRLCEICYKQFLCSLIWRHELEPWEIYDDNNLRQMLIKASVTVPANATRQNLIALSKQNLNRLLGKPKKLTKRKS